MGEPVATARVGEIAPGAAPATPRAPAHAAARARPRRVRFHIPVVLSVVDEASRSYAPRRPLTTAAGGVGSHRDPRRAPGLRRRAPPADRLGAEAGGTLQGRPLRAPAGRAGGRAAGRAGALRA